MYVLLITVFELFQFPEILYTLKYVYTSSPHESLYLKSIQL